MFVLSFLFLPPLGCEVEETIVGNGLRSGVGVQEGTPDEGLKGPGDGNGGDAVKMSGSAGRSSTFSSSIHSGMQQ